MGALIHGFSPRKCLEEEGGAGKLTTLSNDGGAAGFDRLATEGGDGSKSSSEGCYGARENERSGGVSYGGEWTGWAPFIGPQREWSRREGGSR
jgi:hypothetical protein